MGQFAPVAPIQILEALREKKELGFYHLLLAHHVLEEPERFKALFDNYPMCTIFMDNSIVELGDAASDAKVKEACDIIAQAAPNNNAYRQHWIFPVLTDVMADGPETRIRSTESYAWWATNDPNTQYPLFVVLQGDSFEEFAKSADHFLLHPGYQRIAYVGIPRVLVKPLGTRMKAIQYVEAIRPEINVHLLGFSDDVADDIVCCNHPNVEGIDSAVPIRYSYSGDPSVYTPTTEIPSRPKDWFEKGELDEPSRQSLNLMRQLCA